MAGGSSDMAATMANLEGLDFIETEEDVKAVESAALKIQSTFRGRKFRSKAPAEAAAKPAEPAAGESRAASHVEPPKPDEASEEELSKRISTMEMSNDNSQQAADKANAASLPEEEEAERAATKIQAGFKGYKTRKELGGRAAGQQPPPAGPEQRRA